MEAAEDEILREVVRRIRQVAEPDRIILFGSAARGETGLHSDLDLLIIKSGKYDRSQLLGEIYKNLHGVGAAVDAVIVTPEELERYRETHCLVIAPALRDGREVYRARTASS